MKIYLDLLLFLNFFLDFILLLCVSLILKRNAKLKRLLLASLVGALSIFSLFYPFNSFTLFLLKAVISIFMVLISFGFKDIKYTINNIIYLYLVSIILGGALYLINDSLAYKNTGLIFYHNGFSINLVLVFILSPIILFIYVKKQRKLKEEYVKKYEVKITFLNGKTKLLTGFLDTGNNLYDPYKKRPIIVINKSVLGSYNPRCILVPCKTVNKESLLKCFKIKKIIINGKKIETECLVGITDNNFGIEGVDLLLHEKLIKEDLKWKRF